MILTIQKVSRMRETRRSGQPAAKAAFSFAGAARFSFLDIPPVPAFIRA